MATPFQNIIDLALISFKDYKLDNLYNISEEDFTIVLQGFLLKAIPKFYNCKTNLENFDLQSQQFDDNLTHSEKVILSDLTVIEWMTYKILDVTQFQLHLSDTDFKHFAESQNLTAKINTQEILKGRVDHDMITYSLKNINWTNWASGNYGN